MFHNVSSCNKLKGRIILFMAKNFFVGMCFSKVRNLSVAPSEALIQRCSFIKYRASIGRYYFENSCSEYFWEISRQTSATELILSIVMSFQHAVCCECFSRNLPKIFETAFSKDTADRMLLISRTPFNPLTPGDSKRWYILKQTSN